MRHARTLAIALSGLEGTVVDVEADVSAGLPAFSLVGLPDSSMLQARDRVRAAAGRSGASLAPRRITVNLQPAWMPKHGSGFDLAIAVAVLAAQEVIDVSGPAQVVHLGELGLDGRLRPVPGVLPALIAARQAGVSRAIVPSANLSEAQLVDGIEVIGANSLGEVLHQWGADLEVPDLPSYESGFHPSRDQQEHSAGASPSHPTPADFSDVLGQPQARCAAEVAAAGGHHLLMLGPPGAGKTMIASRLPGILPSLTEEDALAVSAVHSVCGRFDASSGLIRRPPFENPHHTATPASIVGGGSGTARPGAVSRAHAGVLFLDEAPEFSASVLEALREPLETGDVSIHRARGVTRYPARFQLVLAANPCPCGRGHGKGADCTCTPGQRRRYLTRLSGPILDRIDMRVGVSAVDLRAHGQEIPESSAVIARRVQAARQRQHERLAPHGIHLNAQVPGSLLRGALAPAAEHRRLLEKALTSGALTLRGHDRVLRLAWTLADLDGTDRPDADHIGRALTLRGGELQ